MTADEKKDDVEETPDAEAPDKQPEAAPPAEPEVVLS